MADSKLVTHSLVESMNELGSRIPFVSRCPSNFEGKLKEHCILRAYEKDSWEDFGTFQEGKKAASYRGQCFQEEEQKRYEKLSCTKLYQCSWIVEKETKEKWPRGRRKAGAVPKIEERYRLRAEAISQKEKEAEYDLRKNSCIVLISNVGEEVAGNRELLQTYKGQQVVENPFRELKSPSMASVIYLKNPERIQALSMLLSFALLVRAIIQYRMRKG